MGDKIWMTFCLHNFVAQHEGSVVMETKGSLTNMNVLLYYINKFFRKLFFLVQDAVQAYHRSNDGVTLQPIVIHMHEPNLHLNKAYFLV